MNVTSETKPLGPIILVVDDDPTNLGVIFDHLTDSGFKILVAQDGESALERARYTRPDLILLDVMMPKMDGFETCRRLKADEALQDIPVIFMTALTETQDKVKGFQLGAVDYITKPFRYEEVVARVTTHLRIRGLTRELREANESLERRVEERTAELAQANKELQAEVAERVRAEQERERLLAQIQEQARRVQGIINTVPEGVILLDTDACILLANPAAREYLTTLANASVGDTLTHLGERPLVELLTSPPQRGLWHEITLDGPPRRIFEMIAKPMEARTGAEGWVLVIRDVTQEREIQQRIQQQERLASVGQLTAGIAHDFNNIMAVIVLYSKLLTRLPDLPSKALDRLETISQQAQQATELIGQILDFSRCSVLERQPLDLAPLLREMVKMLQHALPENIQMELVCEAGEYTVNADPTRMQQVFMNLAVNASDAMLPKGGGILRIELTRMQVDDTKSAPVEEMQPGEWVRVAVTDTGTGIPPDVLPHIFDPFFTTKAAGKGTGLGLAQVYGIVTQHEGHIDVSTAVGQGTTFTLYLHALPAPGEEMRAAETTALVEGHGETVLVVEDHIAARKALRDTLEALNYRVLEARDGEEALAVFEQYSAGPGQRVDLVLTDLVMPVMSGQALFHALRQRDPTVKVVVMTGHPLEEELEDLRLKGLVGLVKKPLNLEQLTQVVSRALEES